MSDTPNREQILFKLSEAVEAIDDPDRLEQKLYYCLTLLGSRRRPRMALPISL